MSYLALLFPSSSSCLPITHLSLPASHLYFVAYYMQLVLPTCSLWDHQLGHGQPNNEHSNTCAKKKKMSLAPSASSITFSSSARGEILTLLVLYNAVVVLATVLGWGAEEASWACSVISVMSWESGTISSKELGLWDSYKNPSWFY